MNFNNSLEINEQVDLVEQVRWEDLQIGDIVCLRKDEIAPADLLILDMSTKFCTIDSQLIDGQIQEQIKHPVTLTSGSFLLTLLFFILLYSEI